MARRPPSDQLRTELDKLALQLVKGAASPATPIRDRVNALKVASGWFGISRKGQRPDDGAVSAWDNYRDSQLDAESINGRSDDA